MGQCASADGGSDTLCCDDESTSKPKCCRSGKPGPEGLQVSSGDSSSSEDEPDSSSEDEPSLGTPTGWLLLAKSSGPLEQAQRDMIYSYCKVHFEVDLHPDDIDYFAFF